MAKIRTLRNCQIFITMTYRDLGILASFVREESVLASGWLAEEGKPTTGLIILKNGKVRLSVGEMNGESVEMGPGEYMGEVSLVDPDQKRGVGAQATENCEYLRIHPTDFQALADRFPLVASKLAQGILESLTHKMESTRELLSAWALEKETN